MRVGINLVGVSYNDGTCGRYRNYEHSIDNFFQYIVNPFKEMGHEVFFYLYTYDNPKKMDIIRAYKPVKCHFIPNERYNTMGGGDVLPNGRKVMAQTYIESLEQMRDEDLDLVISTRYDIKFFKNPFWAYPYDFTKCNFLWKEPEFHHVPLANDTFIVFPYSMLEDFRSAIILEETNPPFGVGIAMHNIFTPMAIVAGRDKVQFVRDEYVTAQMNDLYKLERSE